MPKKVNERQWEKDWSKVKKNDSMKSTPMDVRGGKKKEGKKKK